MGAKRIREGLRETIVLDAGALIAFERGKQAVAVVVAQAEALGLELVIPATALARAWRGGPRSARLARLVDGSEVVALDGQGAKAVGARLGSRRTTDVSDAHVLLSALARAAAVATSDPNDILALTKSGESLDVIPI